MTIPFPAPRLRPRCTAVLLATLLGAAPVTAATAQGAPLPAPVAGQWVRIHTTVGPVYTGRLTDASTADTLWVNTPPHRALRGMPLQSEWRAFPVAANSVSVLERGHDRGRRWLIGGTLLGAGIGLGSGLAIFPSSNDNVQASSGRTSGVAVMTVGGAVAGWFLAKATRVPFSTAWRRAG